MFEPQERKRYSRQIILPEIGLAGQEKLKSAKVLIIGAGGLGCPVLQYLTASGVGHIGIVDNDLVDNSNLHRQILFSAQDVGKNKAIVAAEKLSVLNPFIKISTYPVRLSQENGAELIADYDFVIDGSDNFETRYLVNDICVALQKPWIFGSILRFEGQVSVFNHQNGPTYRCLFPDAEEGDNCEEAGVMGILPGIVGTYMTNEAIKLICNIGTLLSGKLLVINTLTNSFSTFEFSRTAAPAALPYVKIQEKQEERSDVSEISWDEYEAIQAAEPDSILLVDVREYNEFEADDSGGINIPLSDIPENITTFSDQKNIAFYCRSGKRSLKAADMLAKTGFSNQVFWMKASDNQ